MHSPESGVRSSRWVYGGDRVLAAGAGREVCQKPMEKALNRLTGEDRDKLMSGPGCLVNLRNVPMLIEQYDFDGLRARQRGPRPYLDEVEPP